MLKTPENLKWVQSLANDPTKHIVTHNGKYDVKMFGFDGVTFPHRANVHCTLIMSKLVNAMLPAHDLKSLSVRFCGANPRDKDEVVDWIRENRRYYNYKLTFKDAPIEMVKRRNMWDAENTLKLFMIFGRQIERSCPELYMTEQQLMHQCIKIENHGVPIDLTRVKKLRSKSLGSIAKLQKALDELVCPLTIIKKKKRRRKGEQFIEEIPTQLDTFNPNSPIEMEAAFRSAGIELIYKTKPKKKKDGNLTGGGRWSFDEYSMIQYVSKPLQKIIRQSGEQGWLFDRFFWAVNRAVKKHKLDRTELIPPFILKIRELKKMVSTYYDNLIAGAVDVVTEPNGREVGIIHCSFNQAEAKTGRFSSSEPNLQNMPRLLGPRECFIVRRGRWHFHWDYSQVEMKLFGHFAKDPKMAKAIRDDIHRHTASVINKCAKSAVTSEQRKRAKKVNFGPLYGSGAETLAEAMTKDGFPTEKHEAQQWLIAYHKEFPSVRRTTNGFKAQLSQQGYIANPFGRRYHIPVKFAYKALNYMCQGTSADLMKRAMVDLCIFIEENNLKSRMVLTVHDELVLEVPRTEIDIIGPAALRLMEELEAFFIPIEVDLEVVTKRWSEKHEPEEVGVSFNKHKATARNPKYRALVTPWSQRKKNVFSIAKKSIAS